jgi:hypothetical protein
MANHVYTSFNITASEEVLQDLIDDCKYYLKTDS